MFQNIRRNTEARAEAQPEADGGYLASASDLMIGLLFVFIILVVVLALEQQRQAAEAREARKGRKPPIIVVTETFGKETKEGNPTIEVHPETGVLRLPEDMLFESGSAKLSPQGVLAIKRLALDLGKILPCYVAKPKKSCAKNAHNDEIDTIFVEGHTDSRRLQRADGYDNRKLSFDRATAVYNLLVEPDQDSKLDLLQNVNGQSIFSMSGYADTRPVLGLDGLNPKNRRVDLRIVLTYKEPTDISTISQNYIVGKSN